MIEVELDFNELKKEKLYFDNSYTPKNIEEKLLLFLSEKFNIPLRKGWDAFEDFFWLLRYKEWETFEEIDEWKNYEEYLEEKKENSQYGLKNEKGVRDNLLLIFINFEDFKKENYDLAKKLLDFINYVIEETAKYSVSNGKDILDIQIIVKS
ncbi:hypothetical protein O8C83_04745 [Aliarcobacter butzleri]|uniref:hypothetical protein n=1 Tax=Aliarcobacter butzleri TaxID=28197 RepID=UPI00263CAA0B|nr:hypothetical protein [Aliarcobacter butzleri]MDN5100119.1 hypothetical protein [Aliarcobacter butzleri]